MLVGIDLHLKMLKSIMTIMFRICACTFGTPVIILTYFQSYRIEVSQLLVPVLKE